MAKSKAHTVAPQTTPEGWHVVAAPHDPAAPNQMAAALVRDRADAEAVAELLNERAAADTGATPAAASSTAGGKKARRRR